MHLAWNWLQIVIEFKLAPITEFLRAEGLLCDFIMGSVFIWAVICISKNVFIKHFIEFMRTHACRLVHITGIPLIHVIKKGYFTLFQAEYGTTQDVLHSIMAHYVILQSAKPKAQPASKANSVSQVETKRDGLALRRSKASFVHPIYLLPLLLVSLVLLK